jgi:hypothetical protein
MKIQYLEVVKESSEFDRLLTEDSENTLAEVLLNTTT